MANYTESLLQDAIGIILEDKQKHEYRPQHHGALRAALTNREYSIPDLAAIKRSPSRTTSANYLTDTSVTIQTSDSQKTTTITGEGGDSAEVDLTWVYRNFSLKLDHKKWQNNEFSTEQMFAKLLQSAFERMYRSLDSYVITQLEANKNQLQGNRSGLGTWDSSNYVMQVANSDIDNFYNYVEADLNADFYTPPFMDIHTGNWRAKMHYYMNQGQGNSENFQFQFPGFSQFTSTNITNGSDYFSTHYIVPEGGIALLDWVEPFYNKPTDLGTEYWGMIEDPNGFPFRYEVFKTKGASDTSTSNGSKQSMLEQWQVGIYAAFVTAPLSTSNASVIYKYGTLGS